jgi:ubiquinone/menaquinone biosynthesis C-methylase UbiE
LKKVNRYRVVNETRRPLAAALGSARSDEAAMKQPMEESGPDLRIRIEPASSHTQHAFRNGRIPRRELDLFLSSCRQNAEIQRANESNISTFLQRLGGDRNGSTRLMKKLFELWAEEYDQHMIQTGHERAIESLLKQMIELNRMGFGNYDIPIIGRRNLEMSCGTGSVIKLLMDNLREDERRGLLVTANDISTHMKEIAKRKLAGVCQVTWAGQDIREMRFKPGAFDTIMWSQTLHLITDPVLFSAEMEPDGVVEKTDHRKVKTEVIKKVFETLPEGGHFILIDEWPPLFSNICTDPLEAVVNPLFNQTFRPIMDRAILRDKMMRNVPQARFVAELKARINKEHCMYLFVYAKDPDKHDPSNPRSDLDEESALSQRDVEMAKGMAVERVIRAFKAMDAPFRENYLPINGERQVWAEFIPVGSGDVFYSRDFDKDEIEGALASRSYDSIILSRALHEVPDMERLEMILKAVESLKPGGSLMLIDEWPAPSGSTNPIHKRELRDTVMEMFDNRLIFESSLREKIINGQDCGMYGYLYRKIR